jgi:hypothetical protein
MNSTIGTIATSTTMEDSENTESHLVLAERHHLKTIFKSPQSTSANRPSSSTWDKPGGLTVIGFPGCQGESTTRPNLTGKKFRFCIALRQLRNASDTTGHDPGSQ